MTLQQLRYFCEIAAQGWNISQTAKALHTSQPGISRQMHSLETELGLRIFARRKNRIIGLTEPGRAALLMAQRVIGDTGKLQLLRRQFADEDGASLVVAATHTQARYVLPVAVKRFTRAHPRVQLYLKQGVPGELVRLVDSGEADISVSTMPPKLPDEVVMLPCFTVERIVVALPNHPLFNNQRLTLKRIAQFPIITYDEAFIGHSSILSTFDRLGLAPKVVINAVDPDVMKTYAAAGLGIAIMSSVGFNARVDRGLRALQVSHLLGQDIIYLGLRRHAYLRRFLLDFIRWFAPKLTASSVAQAVGFQL